MLPRRSFCGYGIIHTVWFLLRRYWPIPPANCNSPTYRNTHRYAHSDNKLIVSTAYTHMMPQDTITCCIHIHAKTHICMSSCMHTSIHIHATDCVLYLYLCPDGSSVKNGLRKCVMVPLLSSVSLGVGRSLISEADCVI